MQSSRVQGVIQNGDRHCTTSGFDFEFREMKISRRLKLKKYSFPDILVIISATALLPRCSACARDNEASSRSLRLSLPTHKQPTTRSDILYKSNGDPSSIVNFFFVIKVDSHQCSFCLFFVELNYILNI
jgi:hypothetical protein